MNLATDETRIKRGWEERQRGGTGRRILLLICVSSAFHPWLIHSATAQTPKPTPTPSAHATPAAGLSFENYRMVRTRNVFDPDRRSLSAASSNPGPAVVKPSDYVALTGTLLNAGKSLAFFSGSRSDFNRVLGVRDKIAEATITDITSAGVEVDRAGKKVTVAVGQTVPLDNSAPAAAPLAPALPSETGGTTPDTAQNPSATSASAATAAASANGMSSKQQEIMKRMMEKRKQDGIQ